MAENKQSLDTYYGYLFKKSYTNSTDKDARMTVLQYFSDPVTYNYIEEYGGEQLKLPLYEMIFNKSIGLSDNEVYDSKASEYTTAYSRLWYGIVKILTDSVWVSDVNATIETKHRPYFSNIVTNKGYFSFILNRYDANNKVYIPHKKYYIYYDLEVFIQDYQLPEKYYIFYDDSEEMITGTLPHEGEDSDCSNLNGIARKRNTIESVDVLTMLQTFAKDLGKGNTYNGVTNFHYNGSTSYYDETGKICFKNVHQDFFIFYTRLAPTVEECKHAVREQLIIDKGGRDAAAFAYPDLFVNEIRRIFILRNNTGFPVSYNECTSFLDQNPLSNPEIITMLSMTCPLIVENGVSDVIQKYSPIAIEDPKTEEEREANKFLFYLSSIVNYINGSNLDPDFYEETGFEDHLAISGYVQFTYAFVTWQVYKDQN